MLFPWATLLETEHVGEALHTVGLRLRWLGMRFARLRDRLGAKAVFCTDKGKDVPELGRIEHDRRPKKQRRFILEVDG